MPKQSHETVTGIPTKEIAYTPEQVTFALTVLAEHGGDCAAAADELRDERAFEVRARLLREWKKSHYEQYRRLSENAGADMEEQAIQKQRRLINLADSKLEPLLERAGEAEGDAVPQAMRAVADVKAKSSNTLMQLTGRPTSPRDNSTGDIVELLKHMVDRGYMKLAPGVQAAVDGTAEEAD